MKKLFALVAVVMMACVTVDAQIVFQETFSTRRGSTYIVKAKASFGDAWPYASQWFTGYEDKDGKQVEGNQYDNDYTNVDSRTVSIRGKKLNGESDSSVGLYFAASKGEADNYVKFEGALPEIPAEGAYFLHFEICSTETDGGDLDSMILKVNDEAIEVPHTELGDKFETSIVTLSLTEGQIESLYFAFNNLPSQKFINRIWIDAEADQAVENVVLTEKAKKVMVDGVMYIVRDEKLFDVRGTQVR